MSDQWWSVSETGRHIPKVGYGGVHEPDMIFAGTEGGWKIYVCDWPDCDVQERRS